VRERRPRKIGPRIQLRAEPLDPGKLLDAGSGVAAPNGLLPDGHGLY
jgi:hypothetical protein